MSPDRLKEFRILHTKANAMQLIGRFHLNQMPRFTPSTLAIQALVGIHLGSIGVTGQENLENGLSKAKDESKQVIFTLRHRTDADTPVFRMGLRVIDREDVANNAVWIAGTNMLIRPYIFPFSFSERVIYIATPEDVANMNGFSADESLTPLEKKTARWIHDTFHKMNETAKVQVRIARESGRYLVFYPEAGRSRDGFLRRAPREVSIYFPRDDKAIIIPVIVNGTDQFNRPGRNISLEKIMPGNRAHVDIVYGKVYPSGELWEVHRADKSIMPSDVAMAHIAEMDLSVVRMEDMEYYKRILSMLQTEIS